MIQVIIPVKSKGELYDYEVEWLVPKDLETMTGEALKIWRPNLKEKLDWVFGNLRPRICLTCGEPFGVWDMHEGILSRNDVRGWKGPKKLLIMSELNCIPLHHACHLYAPPSRGTVWEYQVEFYGRELLERWYFGLPFKAGPPRLF